MKTNKKSSYGNVRLFSTSIEKNYPIRPTSPPPYVHNPNLTKDQREHAFEYTYLKKLPEELEGKNYKDMPSSFIKKSSDPQIGDVEMTATEIKKILSKDPSLLTINHSDSLSKDDLAYLLVRFHEKRMDIG